MSKWLCLIVSCFMMHTTLTAAYEEYAVIDQVQYFEDFYGINPESGAWFWLDDGSQWMRTELSGPIYYPQEGQLVALVPMTYEEERMYRLWDNWSHYVPFWIVLDGYNVGVAYSVSWY